MRIPFLMRPKHVKRNPMTWQRVHVFTVENALTIGVFAFCFIALLVGSTR